MGDNKCKDGNSTLLHGKYELGRLLGYGTFAKVYHARNLKSGKRVAMKVVGKEKVIQVSLTRVGERDKKMKFWFYIFYLGFNVCF